MFHCMLAASLLILTFALWRAAPTQGEAAAAHHSHMAATAAGRAGSQDEAPCQASNGPPQSSGSSSRNCAAPQHMHCQGSPESASQGLHYLCTCSLQWAACLAATAAVLAAVCLARQQQQQQAGGGAGSLTSGGRGAQVLGQGLPLTVMCSLLLALCVPFYILVGRLMPACFTAGESVVVSQALAATTAAAACAALQRVRQAGHPFFFFLLSAGGMQQAAVDGSSSTAVLLLVAWVLVMAGSACLLWHALSPGLAWPFPPGQLLKRGPEPRQLTCCSPGPGRQASLLAAAAVAACGLLSALVCLCDLGLWVLLHFVGQRMPQRLGLLAMWGAMMLATLPLMAWLVPGTSRGGGGAAACPTSLCARATTCWRSRCSCRPSCWT